MKRAFQSLVAAQVSFFGLIALCAVLLPGQFIVNGISYFGVHQPTIILYSLACVLSSFFLAAAALSLPRTEPQLHILSIILGIAAVLMLAILMFPYSVSDLFQLIHVLISVALFVLEFATSIWAWVINRSRLIGWLFCIELACGLLAAISLPHLLGFEAFGEIGFQFFFVLILERFLGGAMRPSRQPVLSGNTTV